MLFVCLRASNERLGAVTIDRKEISMNLAAIYDYGEIPQDCSCGTKLRQTVYQLVSVTPFHLKEMMWLRLCLACGKAMVGAWSEDPHELKRQPLQDLHGVKSLSRTKQGFVFEVEKSEGAFMVSLGDIIQCPVCEANSEVLAEVRKGNRVFFRSCYCGSSPLSELERKEAERRLEEFYLTPEASHVSLAW